MIDGECCFSLGQVGRIVDTTNTVLAPALLEIQSSGGCVSQNVTTNWLLVVRAEHGRSIHVGHDLIGDHHGNAELVGQSLQHSQETSQVHLSSGQLRTTIVISTIKSSGTVYNQQSVSGMIATKN